MKFNMLVTFIVSLVITANGQITDLAEKLGYPADSRLLIIHADDAAVSHSTDQAVFDAFEKGLITSASVMVPCPWFPEMAEYARTHPEYDIGLHLTYTSEWNTYRWSGIMPKDQISSLLDEQGYFYATTEQAVQYANPSEVDKEMKAQIEKALAAGFRPTHFDSHMLPHFGTQELFENYLRFGEDYRVPVLLPQNYLDMYEHLHIPENSNPVIINRLIEATPDIRPEEWNAYYTTALNNLTPGTYELIVHLAYDNEETEAMTKGFEYYGAAWRQRDVDYIQSEEFQKTIRENNIHLITWKQIQKILYP
jgi:predicted glycoside hydrolase/deacetylase ChbG (UPF0249 family)